MTWPALRSATLARSSGFFNRPSCRHYSAKAASDPLRILFCGSDEFSCAALNALNAEKKRNPGLIESLDVVVRPGKLAGRGMKKIREVPLKKLAEELNLPIHTRDTFTGWQPESSINLIIAVSFGLFVPPRLLKLAKYGGLNVHPSLLPDFRGPAPLHHTLLQRRTHTGVTLQTLHPKSFDHGTVLAQTPLPGIPIPENCTTQDLHDIVTPLAAELLVDGLRRGVHVPPHKDVGWQPTDEELRNLSHAPKLTKDDRKLKWGKMSSDDVVLRQRVLGPVWCEATRVSDGKKLRLILENVQLLDMPVDILMEVERFIGSNGWFERRPFWYLDYAANLCGEWSYMTMDVIIDSEKKCAEHATVTYFEESEGDGSVLIPTHPYFEGKYVALRGGLRVPTIKVEGSTSKPALHALKDFGRRPVGN
ncbi:Methionyl-tRNA formyltransferase [Colletotrichum orbiculare MAFF 240422]|uniref:methionyl-tRNA formyltransferase n=1 Tax=Colletotrichum orbiculare (strain 104-T / ATCC 96160 / CBS 514.97 / LARS 414 / MAFF 240422) TaxID=1213857 RepID=A0A484G8B9_COLOR|nr:Methionyl-tRNA formyltransferase [Colletotrichum orbiculare MAFF 240422]